MSGFGKFEKLETEININCPREEISSKFPVTYHQTQIEVFFDGKLIHYETDPWSETITMLDNIRRSIPGRFNYIKSDGTYIASSTIRIGSNKYDLCSTSSGCKVIIRTYNHELEKHYQSVDIVKNILVMAGFPVEGSICEVTRKVRC